MRFFLLVSLAISLFASLDFEKTYELYKVDDFNTSFEQFSRLAQEENDLDAAYILASMYEKGEGCQKDLEQSAHWYKFAAQGYFRHSEDNSARDTDKEKRKLYHSLHKIQNPQTQETLRKYTQSLYNIKAHGANYFLPVSYRDDGNYAPTNGHLAQRVETEFQVSLKYDFAGDVLGLSEIYSASYTQHSFWQLYEESAYFRETNYNPELFVTFPIASLADAQFVKAFRLAFAHESNGRGGADERSWNYLSMSTYTQYHSLFTELKLWYRLPDARDYNPDLIDYMGHGQLRFMFPYKKHMTQLLLRSNFQDTSAVELNYTYPAFSRDDLFLYVKGFSGYGESLIDYDKPINKIGIGFSISR